MSAGGKQALWLVSGAAQKLAAGAQREQAILQSRTASVRMRTGIAASEWRRAGNENLFWWPAGGAEWHPDWSRVSLCVLPKFYFDEPPGPWLAACESAKANGVPLVLDITDYPYAGGNEAVRAFYDRVLPLSDAVTVNSERMAELMTAHAPASPAVIDDAILGPARNPEFVPAGRLRLVWFGHGTNLRYLNAWLDGLLRFALQRPCRLTVVTGSEENAAEATQALDARCAPALEVRFVEWSIDAMAAALRRCDIVFIPGDPSDPFKAGVSSNRLAEALRAGRFPVASPLPSYLEFADSAWLGEDLIEGVAWTLANAAEVRARIRRGQARIAEKLTAERVGPQWLALFERLAQARGAS